MRLVAIGAALCALALGGCASNNGQNAFGSAPAKPKTIYVGDFVFADEMVAIDRGYTARLSKKIGEIPFHIRKQKTAVRVNDEIVAAIVVALRQAGLDAQPSSEDALTQAEDSLFLSGRLRPAVAPKTNAQRDKVGIGDGRGNVAADMIVTRVGSKRQLFAYTTEMGKARKPGAGANDTAIAAALPASSTGDEKLSADVAGIARAFGAAIGAQMVAYAREQGWVAAAPEPEPEPKKKPAKKPAPKEEKKPEA